LRLPPEEGRAQASLSLARSSFWLTVSYNVELVAPLVAKYLAGAFGFAACYRAMLTLGGLGNAREYHVERYLRAGLVPCTIPVSPYLILNFLAEKVFDLSKPY
jgi:alkylation response protein AidB-like acyl-CoA dehydrogenase